VTDLNRGPVFGHRLRISLATFVFFFSGLLAWSAMQRSTQIVHWLSSLCPEVTKVLTIYDFSSTLAPRLTRSDAIQPIDRFDPAEGIPARQRVIALLTENESEFKQRLQLINHLQQSEIEDIGKWLIVTQVE
jgi:hypothetical protein